MCCVPCAGFGLVIFIWGSSLGLALDSFNIIERFMQCGPKTGTDPGFWSEPVWSQGDDGTLGGILRSDDLDFGGTIVDAVPSERFSI